jgi:hypothetical protein
MRVLSTHEAYDMGKRDAIKMILDDLNLFPDKVDKKVLEVRILKHLEVYKWREYGTERKDGFNGVF